MKSTWTTDKLRTAWIEFFKSKDHHFLASASLVPNEDPSLLWINSGVATLKPYFEGKKNPPSLRLVNSQKAIRTNDIENVGLTARHHTFFEMLGNFSIGDYFKKDAVVWAWEFLTSPKWLNLDPEKLYITVYNEDQETYDLWLNTIKVSKDHIIKGTRVTNFWDMGQGPCGPNTEIYYDRGLKYDPKKQGLKLLIDDIENDRYIEIWNIVFSQFNNDGFNNYSELPRKNIDTGAGLERIISILQDVPTNFDTEVFQTIIRACEKLTPYKYEIDNYFVKNEKQTTINTAFKIISDHIRCLVFAISDGVFPSNKTRGYILRRLIRRAEIYGQKLDINQPFLFTLVNQVIKAMGNHYSELHQQEQLIVDVVRNEEIKFWQTLVSGKQLLLKIIDEEKTISGENAFKLFDTFGYPIELTKEIAQEYQVQVDLKTFEQLLEKHKDNARNARSNVQALAQQSALLTNLNLTSEFVGYEKDLVDDAKIIFLFKDEHEVKELNNNKGYLILNKTPFYAEKGGQAADDGIITGEHGYAHVLDVQSGPNNLNVHYLDVNGKLSKNDIVTAHINEEKRFFTRKNHSGTHLLHSALRTILGTHVMQSGSFNNQDYLRLDFSHFQNVSEEQINKLEQQVQTWINGAYPCEILHLPHEEAIKIGALAFFGEKYDAIVRIIKFGDFSIELCGGTHCHNTKEVEQLLITNIESKGSGSYRVHALTSFKTINKFLETKINELKLISKSLQDKYLQTKTQNKDLEVCFKKINALTVDKDSWRLGKKLLNQLKDTFKKWEKELKNNQEQAMENQYLKLQPIQQADGSKLLIHQFDNVNINVLKNISDHYRNLYQNLTIIFLNNLNQNLTLVIVAISKDLLVNKGDANEILQKILLPFNGKGGGNNLMSQGKINQKINVHDINKIIN